MVVFSVFKDVLTGLLIPAALAVLGYVGKEVAQAYGNWQAAKKARRVRLHRLRALLRASRTAFEVQRAQAGRLAHALGGAAGAGLDSLFEERYDDFTPEQRNDVDHRVTRGKSDVAGTLAQQLNELDAHPWLWLAKYEAWIPNNPRHALVCLADEHEHGLGFPPGIDETLEQVLTEKL